MLEEQRDRSGDSGAQYVVSAGFAWASLGATYSASFEPRVTEFCSKQWYSAELQDRRRAQLAAAAYRVHVGTRKDGQL